MISIDNFVSKTNKAAVFFLSIPFMFLFGVLTDDCTQFVQKDAVSSRTRPRASAQNQHARELAV